MKTLGLLLAALVAVGSAGCTKVDTFNCLQSAECLNGGIAGVCEPGNLCSFPDPNCASGKAFGQYAGDQANLCVGDGGPGTSTSTAPTSTGTSTGTGSATSTGTTNIPGSETNVDPGDGATVDLTTTITSDVTATSGPMTTTDPTMTSDPGTTGPACAPLGDSCGATPCCGGPCTVCGKDGICQALPADQGPSVCGSPCQVCSLDGDCISGAAGQTCPLDCSDIVLNVEVDTITTCFGYGPMPLLGGCNDAGQCSAEPVGAGCNSDVPTVIAKCDTACVLDPNLCIPGASGITKADLCALNGPGPDCKTVCLEDNSSNAAMCTDQGTCQHAITPCGAYKCNLASGLCRTKCMADSDCVSNNCKGTTCVP